MKLQDWLTEKRVRPDDFAARIGCHLATVYRMMKGEYEPRAGTVAKIEEVTRGRVRARDFNGS